MRKESGERRSSSEGIDRQGRSAPRLLMGHHRRPCSGFRAARPASTVARALLAVASTRRTTAATGVAFTGAAAGFLQDLGFVVHWLSLFVWDREFIAMLSTVLTENI